MQKFTKHLIQQPFVFATGLAALVHSTWSLGTLFSGEQPDAGLNFAFVGWIIPAFLIAFALDVGQIVTSAEIRSGQRSATKYATFAVFAAATYYLQWLYIAHHMPALELAPGVRETWAGFAQLVRDAAIWFIPALLPLSTLLYTFSSAEAAPHRAQLSDVAVAATQPAIQIEKPAPLALAEGEAEQTESKPEELVRQLPTGKYLAACPDCGKWSKSYDVETVARNGLKTHRNLHCPARLKPELANGHHKDQPLEFPDWLVEQSKDRR
jgi:hypothetical protein